MSITLDGNNIVFEGTITVANGFNPDSGVAYLILTPSGGYGTLPFLATGDSGLPPEFPSIKMTEVDPATPLPTVNPIVTKVDPGGPGVASKYTMEFFVHKGEQGATGAISISNAVDLSGALGTGTDDYILTYDAATATWKPNAQKVGNLYVASAILATSYSNASPRSLVSITIPGQPFDWYPRCFAQVPITGSSTTQVHLYARLNDPASGAQLGFAYGQVGATPPVPVLIPAPPAGSAVPGTSGGTYGRVSAGAAATIYLRAEQIASSSASWSTAAAPSATYCVEVAPLA